MMEYSGYLFAHFIGEQKDGEQIYFSVSRDGLHWKDLNGGKPVLYSNVGELGARDPFLIRSPWTHHPDNGGRVSAFVPMTMTVNRLGRLYEAKCQSG